MDFKNDRFDISKIKFENPCGYLPQAFPIDEFILFENIDDFNSFFTVSADSIVSPYARQFTNTSTSSSIDVTLPRFANWMVN